MPEMHGTASQPVSQPASQPAASQPGKAKKRAKEMARELKEEEKGALDLAALKVPTSKGVYWDRRRSRWRVQLKKYGKQWHEGLGAGIDDHTKAVASCIRDTRARPKMNSRRSSLDNRQ
jgi:hypothetical protein